MFLREIKEPVSKLRGAGPAAAAKLSRLGITTIGALLCHFPRDWDDRSRPVPLKNWNTGRVSTEAEVLAKDWFGFGRKKTLKIYVEDESARACLVCFNRPFMERQLPVGTRFRLYGQFDYRYGEIQSSSFEVEKIPAYGKTPPDPVMPVYPLTEGLTQGHLRKFIRQALDLYLPSLENELPDPVLERNGLLEKSSAVKAIHFPSSLKELEKAKKTLIYEELFHLEIMVGLRALQRRELGERREEGGVGKEKKSGLEERLIKRLPYSLTPGQETVIAEINSDMESPFPMARLLQGDVGSGKTLVSFLACLKAVEKGGQAALMAPTELLARQHAENAAWLLEPLGIRIGFLTGNLKAQSRALLLRALESGEIDFVAGTHALFSRDVVYKNLSLVVVDEQHRFGVVQRQAIMAKGEAPGLLMMSATPIPRSLALTVFGDLECSVIPDMPPGRKPVKTHLAKESNEGKVYDFVRRELAAGHQGYFVYPLIEGGDENEAHPGLKDAVSMAERLAKEVFPDYPLALLHSKVDEEKKLEVMNSFRKGEIKILAATSVVEVGVDVPNATCMVIEHAERFGLAALHQLRGRVGRDDKQSYCFLVYSDQLTEDGIKRLKVMMENSDGFIIAEEDLKLRGPGQVAGVEQSGYFKLGIADPIQDAQELGKARLDAFAILESDPSFANAENRCIAEVLKRAPPFNFYS